MKIVMKSIIRVLLFTWLLMVVFSLGTVSANDLTLVEKLGKNLFFDNISDPDWMACAACHAPDTGWTGPIAGINSHGAVYRGAVPTRFGNRKPPSAGYATLSPILYFDETEGLFIGGNFWDGRATGWMLRNPAADQALGPFLNPVEQNNPSKKAVCEQVADSKYAGLFEDVWGAESLDCSMYGVEAMYDKIGLSIAAYENSSEVNQFSSKYDAYKAGMVELSAIETTGMGLFKGKAKCVLCHVMDSQGPNGEDLFTDFTFDNLGVPRNPKNPFYEMDKEFLDDDAPINPEGRDWIDHGLGGLLRSLADPDNQSWRDLPYVTNVKDLTNEELMTLAADNDGKHKVPTLRNVDKRYGVEFPKSYGHNGYFKSLKSIVHFYNTRDVKDTCPDPFTTEKDALSMNCWPVPEVADNVNTDELGDLGLTDYEENAIVVFMKTLSDGFKVKKKDK
jgi:cytochrome c peroxidase